jgi:hypothetical protein
MFVVLAFLRSYAKLAGAGWIDIAPNDFSVAPSEVVRQLENAIANPRSA